ncbi:MAG: hypothetical protein JSW66_09045 [Phycisphaerales bacterium]|nr:MAG: hypothetical protein JSW66_09045 [Phycisphaerales bacterium]
MRELVYRWLRGDGYPQNTCRSAIPLLLCLAWSMWVNVRPAQAEPTALSGLPRIAGLAAKYPNEAGIGGDPDVVFADDFESWKNGGTEPPWKGWSVRRNKTSRTRVVPGRVAIGGSPGFGEGILEVACWSEGSGSQVGGLSLKLGNYNHANEELGDGYDELYIRYYIKFDQDYRGVRNHGANLGGRDVTRKGAAWVGTAGIKDVSTRGYFYSGVQPYGRRGDTEFEMGFYSYHLDKKGPWGENYPVQNRIPISVGTWHCVERHMKLNSVDTDAADGRPDGVEELWIDGQLSIRNPAVRFRRVERLHITLFCLETYYHGLPEEYGPDRPIKVYFDNVVIAKRYIGPVRLQGPNPNLTRD